MDVVAQGAVTASGAAFLDLAVEPRQVRAAFGDALLQVGPVWVELGEDFVQAVADVCSRDSTERERRLQEASALMAGQRAFRPRPYPVIPSPGERGARAALVEDEELVRVQRQTLDVHDMLLRAWERAADLERERGNANRMVVVLTMVDKLHRDTASLATQPKTMA
ncbi:hypothetical protein [Streptomyces stelliscabiei]|uniref:hypothetical protein n=1 Tax=Streptomyces stelliscabiei TaxID=146820 RepID=UPI0029B00AB9|nr:hypothetical protein [Streptomyces stelliscabiei]MDX3435656.1 hypothetical protein [Streptomyces stelliscabiei]MDX3622045.1 hypothetical protein [Streptomyces stelliscabiei]